MAEDLNFVRIETLRETIRALLCRIGAIERALIAKNLTTPEALKALRLDVEKSEELRIIMAALESSIAPGETPPR